MCGILGGWWLKEVKNHDSIVIEALKKIDHRGPDDKGYEKFHLDKGILALGHTRLAIIDLSSSGHQPMTSQNGIFTVVFNGEIYNYKELKKDLIAIGHTFLTDTDTEVVLVAWEQWGYHSLDKFVGMFSFAMFNNFDNSLTCVRDAFGIKPFFYTFENGNFYFASEIDSIKVLKNKKVELNVQASYDYLVHGVYDSKETTFFKDIKHLLPAYIMRIDLSENKIVEYKKWWTPTIKENKGISFNDAVDKVREEFLSNLKMHMRSDVSIGAALSGGVDSSAIVCAMRHIEPDIEINTFSYIAKNSRANEEKWVDLVNKNTNSIENKISTNSHELIRDIDKLIVSQGEPFGSTSIYAQYRVLQCAQEKGIKVMLEGQGADELIAGYDGYPGSRIRSLIEEGNLSGAYHFLNEWSKWPGRSKAVAIKNLLSDLMPHSTQGTLRNLNGMPPIPKWLNAQVLLDEGIYCQHPKQKHELTESGRRVIAELANSLNKRGLPHLLRHGDRNAMAFSIENRVPFLTVSMADLMLSLPESYLISSEGETKSVFRSAMRGIVPDEILYRKDKIGFETPELQWMIKHEQIFKNWLKQDLGLPFLNQKEVIKSFEDIISGKKKFSWQAWRWINFYRWYSLNF